jgi:hypothetical protein
METKLANSIAGLAKSNYIPFQGFNEEVIIKKVQSRLDVTEHQIKCALEIIADRG